MNKLKTLRIVNFLLIIVFFSIASSGLLYWARWLNIPYATFKIVHPITGLTLVVLVLIHLVLNYNWIKANYLKKRK
jgi:predicted ferric reductase